MGRKPKGWESLFSIVISFKIAVIFFKKSIISGEFINFGRVSKMEREEFEEWK
jgi:hypothetical protein